MMPKLQQLWATELPNPVPPRTGGTKKINVISRNRIECRVLLSPGVAATQRLQIMEIIEKWSLALTGAKPSKFVGASNLILFAVYSDRDTTFEGLRRCLPGEFVKDVVIDGVSWSQSE